MAVEVGKVKFVSFWKTAEFYIIVGCVCGGILVIAIIVIAVCLCRRRRRQEINGSLKRSSAIELNTGMCVFFYSFESGNKVNFL